MMHSRHAIGGAGRSRKDMIDGRREAILISSSESDGSDDEVNGKWAEDAAKEEQENGEVTQDAEKEGRGERGEVQVADGAGDTEPSFGALLAAKFTEPVSIAAALPSSDAGALVPLESSKLGAIPSGITLSTVLTQALRTNDNNLLESCLHNTDTDIIRSTIQRLDSSLAGTLIQKLAERLSRRPGRYGNLLVWVQWICVAHGGAIGSRPDVQSHVRTLYQVLNQRSKALDSLLLLKGKLDMLDAQLGLRKRLLADRGPIKNPDQGHLVYVEGEDESSDEDDATGGVNGTNRPKRAITRDDPSGLTPNDGEGSDIVDEGMVMRNGDVAESDESDLDTEDGGEGPFPQREDGLVDDEAEESDEDSHPSDREDDESEEEDFSEDGDEDSEMNDFIDDGPIEEVDSMSEVSIHSIVEQPPAKKTKMRN